MVYGSNWVRAFLGKRKGVALTPILQTYIHPNLEHGVKHG